MGRGRRGPGRRRSDRRTTRKHSMVVEGTVHVSGSGRSTIRSQEGTYRVAAHGLREAMDGDVVRAAIVREPGRGQRAFVQSVVERAHSSVLGAYHVAGPLGAVVPLDTRMGNHDFFVLPDDDSARACGVGDGDVVVADIVTYPRRREAGVVTIRRRVGAGDAPNLAIESVIAMHDLPGPFPEAVLKEAGALELDVDAALAQPGRRDVRDLCVVTIDPTDARDYDDAVFARRTDDGYELVVCIADVTHYVQPESHLDVEARTRTCSAYLVDRVIPMLPEALSNNLCSLVPHEPRLAMAVSMRLDARGNVRDAEAFPCVMESHARLTYDEVDKYLLEGVVPGALAQGGDAVGASDSIGALDEIAALRGERRRERGAIDFASSESKVALDDQGRPVGVVVRSRTRATMLVEEAMLCANEAVAAMLAAHDLPCCYRVHDQPPADHLTSAAGALQALGLTRGIHEELLAGSPHAMQEVLARANATPAEYAASALLLRAQARATYGPHNEGHFALGAKAYCHFTSPIRRYPDMVVHRTLKALLSGGIRKAAATDEGQLALVCQHCSEREREADVAATESQKVKMAELYADRVGTVEKGVVSGVHDYGVFVTLDVTGARALMRIRDLGDEWFEYDDRTLTLTGAASGDRWQLGRRVEVLIDHVDVSRGNIDVRLART